MHLCALFSAFVEKVEGARSLHPGQNTRCESHDHQQEKLCNHNKGFIPGAAPLGVWVRPAGIPGVAWLLWSAALQLLHQHLAAPPQSIADLPKGAAAPQGAVAVLRDEDRTLKCESPG